MLLYDNSLHVEVFVPFICELADKLPFLGQENNKVLRYMLQHGPTASTCQQLIWSLIY